MDAKVAMIQPRSFTSLVFIGAVATTVMAPNLRADAGDVTELPRVIRASDRCAVYGPDIVDMGNGICGRLASHARIEVHPRAVDASAWTVNGTSSANLRSDGAGMVPGANASQHLRVRSGLDSYNPFR